MTTPIETFPSTARDKSSVHATLRDSTRADHDRVDAAFGTFDLTDARAYACFLSAHARVVPALERQLSPAALLGSWTGRSAALIADLAALNQPMPPSDPVALPGGTGAKWGALYVLEGSRLGGALLARQVGHALPRAYLASTHEPGGWKRVLAAIEDAADGPGWLTDAVAGAGAVFTAYARAANEERDRA